MECPQVSKNTLKKRRQRVNQRQNPERLAEVRRKDRERKKESRNAMKRYLQTHPRKMKTHREKKKLEMRKFQTKKKSENQNGDSFESRRETAAKSREWKKKDRKRKYDEALKEKVNKTEKEKEALRVQKWRMRIKLNENESDTENESEETPPFPTPSCERRAVRKAKEQMPKTPQKRAKVLQKLVDSPTTRPILETQGVVPSERTNRKLQMASNIMDSLSGHLNEVKSCD